MERKVKLFFALIGLGSCPKAETLDAYRKGELGRKESEKVRKHLEVCSSCREDMKLFEKFPYPTEEDMKKIEEMGRNKPLDPDLTERLQDLYYLVYPPRAKKSKSRRVKKRKRE